MRKVKRSAAIVRPKSPFIKWANSCPAAGDGLTAEYITEECTAVFLIPKPMSIDATPANTLGWRYINSAWEDIFTEMLRRWDENEWHWPQYRSRKIFGQWFKIEFHDRVVDAVVRDVE